LVLILCRNERKKSMNVSTSPLGEGQQQPPHVTDNVVSSGFTATIPEGGSLKYGGSGRVQNGELAYRGSGRVDPFNIS
jgi:hypothetical protein